MTPEIMNKIAVRARQMILENIRQGIDINGKRFSYSEKPFARPFDKRIKGYKQLIKDERLTVFKKDGKNNWMVVEGGYKDYRRMRGQNPDGDFLTDTGAELRNFQIIELTATIARLGFTDPKQLKKSLWQNTMGVGKSKKLWQWMGLRKEQVKELAEYAASLITGQYIEQLLKGIIK